MEKSEDRLYIEDHGVVRRQRTTISIFLDTWFHYVHRVKISIIEGYYKTYEEAMETIRKYDKGERPSHLPDDYPKHFEIVCNPVELMHLSEKIQELCKDKK